MHMAALTASDTFIEERKPEMTHALDMAIMKLNEQLGLSASALNEGLYVDASSEPEAVLEQVDVAGCCRHLLGLAWGRPLAGLGLTASFGMVCLRVQPRFPSTEASRNVFVWSCMIPCFLPQLDAAAAKIASMEDMCKTYNKWQGLFG